MLWWILSNFKKIGDFTLLLLILSSDLVILVKGVAQVQFLVCFLTSFEPEHWCGLHKEALLGRDSTFVRKKKKRLRCPPPTTSAPNFYQDSWISLGCLFRNLIFVWWNFTRNWDKIFEIWKVSDLEGFSQLLEIRQRKEKNRQISIMVFSFIATINTEGLLKICTSYWVYNQIWLNNRGDDHHLFYIFISLYGWSPLKLGKKIL
jgi:hypothetical protein